MKKKREIRSAWIKMRVTVAEKENILAKAAVQGQTVTDFIRQRALDYRLRQAPLEKELLREIARIGNNLNQLARWARTYKNAADSMTVITELLAIEKELETLRAERGCGCI